MSGSALLVDASLELPDPQAACQPGSALLVDASLELPDPQAACQPGSALLVDASLELPDPQAACQPSATAQDDLQERVSPSPPALISEQIKDLEGDLAMTEEKGEGAQIGGSVDANGVPASGASLSTELEPEHENHRSYDEEITPVGPSIPTSHHAEETCELLSETSIEVPNVKESCEIDGVAIGSQNNANMQYEGFSQDLTQPHEKYSGTGKRRIVNKKQEGRKQPRYRRRGRGRGKQN